MLIHLTIRNFLLIQQLDIDFKPGFCILTGETGAGKSILLNALKLILGERSDYGVIRDSTKPATVAAEFTLTEKLKAQLDQHGLSYDDTLLLRRLVDPKGKSRAFINDQPVSATLMKEFGTCLIEIEGQMESASILQSKNHLKYLDTFAQHSELIAQTQATYNALQQANKSLLDFEAQAKETEKNEAFIRHALEEILTLSPEENEIEELLQKREFAKNGEQINAALNKTYELLESNDGMQSKLFEAIHVLEKANERCNLFSPLLDQLEKTSIELKEALDQLQNHVQSADQESPLSLEEVDERLYKLRTFARRHQLEENALHTYRDDLELQLASFESFDDKLAELQKHKNLAEEDFKKAAAVLHASRKKHAKRFEEAICVQLPALHLPKVKFQTRVRELAITEASALGLSAVCLEASTNPGQPIAAIDKIASGGELTRLKLAIRVALTDANPVPTLILDEADTGVGGATANAVGQHLKKLGKHMQIITITHSPQVASLGEHHWRISKQQKAEDTVTSMQELTMKERHMEVARMLAGDTITPQAKEAASALLAQGTAA